MPKVIVIAGTAGTGKTTIGVALANHYHTQFIEGDNLHPKTNIDKMSHGIPLTDEDRWGWLKQISEFATTSALENAKLGEEAIAVVSCSALKKVYRDLIRETSPDTEFIFTFLYCSVETLIERVTQRKGHYMKSDMIQSQFDILQLPKEDEPGCIVLDVTECAVEEVLEKALDFVDGK
ncbi:hypothetical protein WICPIJ_001101 [Wickerhamomyces pijperi]|uniref:Gluconokinase n=1 Tax=Wickerhamomyces pijperi TaxID=599730 RepID=A0A9P8TQY1_WICPI|nr:hypothetical protein WICPIJ_001101 [Wickerhamomyces pijperi]